MAVKIRGMQNRDTNRLGIEAPSVSVGTALSNPARPTNFRTPSTPESIRMEYRHDFRIYCGRDYLNENAETSVS
jgi:hypothetical protein